MQSHHTIRLRGRGIPRLNGGGGKGDHLVHIKIKIPKYVKHQSQWCQVLVSVVYVIKSVTLCRQLSKREKEVLLEYAQMENLPDGSVDGVDRGQ